MAKEVDMNIDYEKLRKALVARETLRTAIVLLPSNVSTTNNIYSASPEQLINFARRAGINIEKFRIKDKKK
ncbi:hypothetical protein SAMN04487760_10225 [Lachnospiraceae bacterium G41]|nr:hypothetical protein SAMN04487760_10225 [Lachnospiraceae bacterium G41]